MIDLINGDCNKVMKDIDKNSIDLIITSPPYEDFHGAGYSAQMKDILFLKFSQGVNSDGATSSFLPKYSKPGSPGFIFSSPPKRSTTFF